MKGRIIWKIGRKKITRLKVRDKRVEFTEKNVRDIRRKTCFQYIKVASMKNLQASEKET